MICRTKKKDVMFFSLDQLVTKNQNQIINAKCQPKIFVIVTIWKEKRKSYALSFYRSQNVCAGPNFLRQIYLHIVAVTNILYQTRRWFAFSKIGFCASTKAFEEALNAVKFLGWLKKFGPAKNILGPVKGQGISKYVLETIVPYIGVLKNL